MAKGDKQKVSKFSKAATVAGVIAQSGKRAIKGEYRERIEVKEPWRHTDSIDLDVHFERAEPNSPRWDYGVGVGHQDNELLFWIEPHPASSTGEVARLVEKVRWLKNKLTSQEFVSLKNLTDETLAKGYAPYCWMHSGALRILPGSKEARMLAQAGIRRPSRQLELPVK